MALYAANTPVELREVVLRDKPKEMLEASQKGTVPVLALKDGKVIDESLDIIRWALNENDEQQWLPQSAAEEANIEALIAACDGEFKHHLDRFKYATRYQDVDPLEHQRHAHVFLERLNMILSNQPYLAADRITLADIAIFPFIRQYVNADKTWNVEDSYTALETWLTGLIESRTFTAVMEKYNQWKPGDEITIFPANSA